MASLQLKNVDDDLYSWLKQFSKNNNLSMSQQVVSMLKEYSKINQDKPAINPVDEFLDNTPYFDKATIDDFDLLIASSALCNDLVLATNNLKHFENIPDLKIINPLS